MDTIWKPIPQDPTGLYLASQDGQILRKEYVIEKLQSHGHLYRRVMPEKIVKQCIKDRAPSHGVHPIIQMRSSTQYASTVERRVSSLIAAAWHGLPYEAGDRTAQNDWRIGFIDGDPSNVHADNLEWVSNQGVNTHHSHDFYYENLKAYRAQAAVETAESFLARYYSPDEIDWSTAERIAA
ncbi:HNH endonuclease [Mycobacterium phage Skinny]|uniref:HNH endonuclease n=6 Tax=Bongovirus bongo TaxID=1983750 RepID=A0A0M4S3A4_9CAUD|nr:hypothetical protein PEGLEG_81 [Mycobacterium phage PegLeg]YP_009604940.1 hypothetical protein FDH95_gp082 [Mycobacterium phage Bongo]ALF00609.1 hypothetical protein SEA_BRICOLE_81 [Mycobacterium phage Bricole]AXQ52722.1 HNH endonuclease [Mycobacterium phage IPhane7]QDH93656.1 HNH endonuclease [Mycobacterium phage LilhomieP]QGJ93227.1 HNH endonuclease [Mycobacterium phage TyDawg]QUU29282.1 HNH endonuclease [Mycobacterium phage SirSheldon]UXE05279.1 HNH endonuclease [Mycobacterium phage Sk